MQHGTVLKNEHNNLQSAAHTDDKTTTASKKTAALGHVHTYTHKKNTSTRKHIYTHTHYIRRGTREPQEETEVISEHRISGPEFDPRG